MKIEELQEKMLGVYDFSSAVDCQSIIRMLLTDLETEKVKNDNLNRDLRVLARSVIGNSKESLSIAEGILKGVRKKSCVMDFLGRMSEMMDQAESMSDKELHDAVMVIWAEYGMESRESGLLGEILKRFKEKTELGKLD